MLICVWGLRVLLEPSKDMQTTQTAPAAMDLADPATCHLLRPCSCPSGNPSAYSEPWNLTTPGTVQPDCTDRSTKPLGLTEDL